jgi:hypothetical protein
MRVYRPTLPYYVTVSGESLHETLRQVARHSGWEPTVASIRS